MIEQLATATDGALVAEIVELQAQLSRLQFQQLAVLAELNSRNVAGTLGYRGLSQLIATQLRCTQAEARKRYLAVERFGARRSLTGEQLQPVLPATAEAFAAGEIGPEHAAVVAETVEAIPAAEQAEHSAAVETTLLEHARTSNPHTLRQLGQRILAQPGSGRAVAGGAASAADPPQAGPDPAARWQRPAARPAHPGLPGDLGHHPDSARDLPAG